ncbi:MAG: WD40 repeat domain-containing serine/threonine protein kinase [Planctomycetota bacterium]
MQPPSDQTRWDEATNAGAGPPAPGPTHAAPRDATWYSAGPSQGATYGGVGAPDATVPPQGSRGAQPSPDLTWASRQPQAQTVSPDATQWSQGGSGTGPQLRGAATPVAVGAQLGPYRLDALLGQGGMGAVYRAWDLSAGRWVALKVITGIMDDGDLERFRREGQLAARLRHPGIVGVHAFGEHQGVPYLATELVEGARTLTQGLREPDLGQKLGWILEAARALGHAHGLGVVHRDVKPDNVLIDAAGRARVADFGLAASRDLDRLTHTGAFLGTPAYVPPEQGRSGVLHPTMDVWALGVMLYEALTGRRPFAGTSLPALLLQIAHHQPDAPRAIDPSVSPSLEAVCLRALAKEPEDRYQDGDAFADDLERALAGERVEGAPGGGRGRVALLAAALLLVVGGLGLTFVLTRRGAGEPAEAAQASPDASAAAAARAAAAAARAEARRADERWTALPPPSSPLARTIALEAFLAGFPQHRRAERARRELESQWLQQPLATLSHFSGPLVQGRVVVGALLGPRTYLSSSTDGTIKWWDLDRPAEAKKSWNTPRDASGVSQPFDALLVTRGGRVVGSHEDNLILFPEGLTLGMEQPQCIGVQAGATNKAFAVHPSREEVVVGGYARVAIRFDLEHPERKPLRYYPDLPARQERELWAVAISPDGKRLATACGDIQVAGSPENRLRLWDLERGAELAVLRTDQPVTCLAWSPDGRRLAAGTIMPGRLLLYDADLAPAGELIDESQRHESALTQRSAHAANALVRGLVWSADGERLFSSCDLPTEGAGDLRAWDPDAKRPLLRASPRQPAGVFGLALTPDGRRLIAAMGDGTVQVWLGDVRPR